MTIQLKPGQEQAINAAIRAGAFRSVDEFMDTAITILTNSMAEAPVTKPGKSRLRELREGLSLGDLSIKELIEEGRE
jgi:Arc/MetJ-type ribon-helix-helix transcriptional regulator